ncbi:site-specific integrase [Bradyrhizobium sp.]|jgi:integrase|uniref:tyrosine-type recombinase/integrase n=1 Tax=Bradyrhizobium sp. TaxID=376 RepID=UPI002DDCFC16|nr:site-specific integrase [Bradyrhizobium sp.]HEV2155460.1 site-specific integrase [Bradyrhizobium sp.]
MPTYNLQQHDNGVFYIHWTEGRRSKRHSTGQTEETAAQIYLGEFLKGEAADRGEAAPVYLIEDLLPFYTNYLERKGSSPRKYECKNLLRHFGKLTLAQVATSSRPDEPTKIDEYIDLREAGEIGQKPASPETIRNELGVLKSALNWCAAPKQALIKPSDLPVFELPPGSPPRDRWLRAEQVQLFLATAAEMVKSGDLPQKMEWLAWIALETAARCTAILQLSKKRIDFELKTIDYRLPGARETRKRRTVVPISAALEPHLRAACAAVKGDLLFDGFSRGSFYGYMRKIGKRAEIELSTGPHVMRHTAATHMLRNGVAPWIVAGVLADTIATVERVYGHHIPSDLRQGVENIYGGLRPAE